MPQNNPLTAILAESPFVLLDGAMATELEARGCDLADSLWSAKVLMENPQLIYDVHLDYFRAGAQVAITASYQATPEGFAARGLDETQSRALIARSVELARQARDAYRAENPAAKGLLIAGSIGPYGAYLADGSEYRGDYQRSAQVFQHRRISRQRAGVQLRIAAAQPQHLTIRQHAVVQWAKTNNRDSGPFQQR